MKKYLPELQVLSGIAILCVVLIHSNAYYLFNTLNLTSYADAGFKIQLLDNFIHGAVQIFIFISGFKYALHDINTPYKKYIITRIIPVLKPFLVISTFFFIKDNVNSLQYLNFKTIFDWFIDIFMGYNSVYQLWYIPLYIFVIASYPLIYKLFKNNFFRWIFIFSIIFIQQVFSKSIPMLETYPFSFVYYYIFFELGFLCQKYNFKNTLNKYIYIFILTYIIFAIVLIINPIPQIQSFMRNYLFWPISVLSYYFISLKLQNSKILLFLGKYSFYIFLLHEPIINKKICSVFNILGIYHSIFSIFVATILTILISVLLYKLIENTFINTILFKTKK